MSTVSLLASDISWGPEVLLEILQDHGSELGEIQTMRIMLYNFIVTMPPSASISNVSPQLSLFWLRTLEIFSTVASSFRRNFWQSDLLSHYV